MTIGYSSVPISAAVFAENGAKVITTHADETLRIWETSAGKEIKKLKIGENAPLLIMSGEQKVIVPIGKWGEQKLKLFDIRTGKQVRTFYQEFASKFEGVSMSPNGTRFITANSSGEVLLWDINKDKAIREFEIGYSGDDAIAFSPDGKTFAVGGRNQNLFVFDVETGEKIWQLIPSYEPDDFEKELAAKARKLREVIHQRLEARKKQAEIDVEKYKPQITAKFSHYGDAESFWDQRIAESGTANKSKLRLPKEKATVSWFTLTNDSDLPVSIDTNSMILNQKCKGLCNGAEISSRYTLELKNGETRVNGSHMYAETILPPKTTVYFSVALADFEAAANVYLGFTFQKDNPDDKDSDDYGTEQKLYIRKSDLPK
jgi:WD40 repeat protein